MKNLFSYTLVKYCVTSAPSPLQPTNHPPEEQHTYSLTWWCGRYVGGWIILCLCFWLQWKLIPGGTKGIMFLTLIYYKNTSHEELNPFNCSGFITICLRFFHNLFPYQRCGILLIN